MNFVDFNMRWFLLIGFACFQLLGFTQQSAHTIELQIDSYLEEAQDSLYKNLPYAVQAGQQAVQLAQKHHLRTAEQKCYLSIAGFYEAYEDFDLVVRNHDRAIAMGLPNSTRLQYRKLPFLERIEDVDKAIADAKKIAGIARRKGDHDDESNAYVVIGKLYRKRGDHDKALNYLKKADKVVDTKNVQQRAVVQGHIGDSYNQLNKNSEAEQYYQQSIEYGKQARDTALLVENFDRINDIYKQQKRSKDIISLNNRVVDREKSAVETNDTVAEIVEGAQNDFWVRKVEQKANFNLAAAYLENDSSEAAIEILNDLEENSNATDLEQSRDVHKMLSQAYDQNGRHAKALEEYKVFVKIQDSLLKEKDLRIKATLKKNIALQALENQVVFLEKDRELSAKSIALNESNLQQQQTIIIAVVVIALVSLLFLIIVVRKNRARATAYNLLELKSLRTKMNPHFIFNSLNSVNHFIAQNDEKSANKYLSRFSKLMREVLDSSDKDFITLEKELDLLKVYLALEHQRFENKFSYKLHVEPEVENGDYMIPPMLIQPFIENAIWHGLRYVDYPGILEIRFLHRENGILIEVEDNGIGRKASRELKTKSQHQHKSSGIRLSQNRIELSNKVYGEALSVQIIDKDGDQSGTLVQISIQNKDGN